MTPRVAAWFVCALAALCPAPALAAGSGIQLYSGGNAVARPRLGIGWFFGESTASELVIDGRKQDDEGGSLSTGLALSYAQGFFPHVGAIVVGRYGSQPTAWSDHRHEGRTRLDLALGPEFTLSGTMFRTEFDFYVAVPVGPSLAWLEPNDLLGVTDSYSTGVGFVLDASAGFDLFWEQHGAFTELGYVRQFTRFTHHATLDANSAITVKDHYHYDQQGALFVIGYAYRF